MRFFKAVAALAVVAALTVVSSPAGAQSTASITGWGEYGSACSVILTGTATSISPPNPSGCDILLTGRDIGDLDVYLWPSTVPASVGITNSAVVKIDMPAMSDSDYYESVKVGKHTAFHIYPVHDYNAAFDYDTNSYPVSGWNVWIQTELLLDEGYWRIYMSTPNTDPPNTPWSSAWMLLDAEHHQFAEADPKTADDPASRPDVHQGWDYRLDASAIPSSYLFAYWLEALTRASLDEYCGGGWADWHDDGNSDGDFDDTADGTDYKEPDPVAGGYCIAN